jgi:hypothetical protein
MLTLDYIASRGGAQPVVRRNSDQPAQSQQWNCWAQTTTGNHSPGCKTFLTELQTSRPNRTSSSRRPRDTRRDSCARVCSHCSTRVLAAQLAAADELRQQHQALPSCWLRKCLPPWRVAARRGPAAPFRREQPESMRLKPGRCRMDGWKPPRLCECAARRGRSRGGVPMAAAGRPPLPQTARPVSRRGAHSSLAAGVLGQPPSCRLKPTSTPADAQLSQPPTSPGWQASASRGESASYRGGDRSERYI